MAKKLTPHGVRKAPPDPSTVAKITWAPLPSVPTVGRGAAILTVDAVGGVLPVDAGGPIGAGFTLGTGVAPTAGEGAEHEEGGEGAHGDLAGTERDHGVPTRNPAM